MEKRSVKDIILEKLGLEKTSLPSRHGFVEVSDDARNKSCFF